MDPVYPLWGHYARRQPELQEAAQPGSPYLDANISWTTSDGRPPICKDFYTNSTGTPAFSYASTTYCTTPGGDVPVKSNINTATTYAQTVAQVLNLSGTITNSTSDTTWETKGYAGFHLTTGTSGKFNGYTLGPGYWGETFFIWPPDPTNDWRTKYFTFTTNTGNPSGKPDNVVLWSTSQLCNGRRQAPAGYQINYTNILNFIINSRPMFPSQLQSGRIVYYTQIPTSISTSTWPPTDLNQRFWKDYIDYVLGVIADSVGRQRLSTVINSGGTGLTGYGDGLHLGNRARSPPSSSLHGWRAIHELRRQSAAAAVELLVRPDDDDRLPRQLQPLVHRLRQRLLALLLVAGDLPRGAAVCLQTGHPGGPERHPEQPPQRHDLADHVQHAADQRHRHQRHRDSTACASPWGRTTPA